MRVISNLSKPSCSFNHLAVGGGIKPVLLSCFLATLSSNALALSFELGDDARLDWDTSVRYSSAWRLNSQDPNLLTNPNADDGNRSFDKGLIQSRFDLISEADLSYRNIGAFARVRGYYDDKYAGSNDHDSPATSNKVSVPFNEFTDDTQELMGKKLELLDAFAYGNFDFGERSLGVRVGRQVVNWGESLFIAGGISSAQGPLDATKLNVPGMELKEVFLPVGQLYLQQDLTESLTAEAFYQWQWEETRLDAAGSYFSTSDVLDQGGESLILGPGLRAARGSDDDASDSGQWGVALRYTAEALGATEFGLYYINYHDKTPQVNLDLGTLTYNLSYLEDIHLVGASFGTVFGDTNVSGEISYRDNAPVLVPGGVLGFQPQRAEVVQAQVSAIHIFGENPLMDNLTLTAEAGYNRVLDLNDEELVKDQSAWGYTLRLQPDYFGVLPGLDLQLPVTFSQGVEGNSSVAGTFTEGKDKLGITARFTYLSDYQLELGYVNFLGSSDENSQADRDFVSLAFKTAF